MNTSVEPQPVLSRRGAEWACLVLGSVPGALLAVTAGGLIDERSVIVVFALSFVGLNLMHNAATWERAYLGPRAWRAAPIERALIPALLVAGALLFEAVGGGALLLGVQYYLSFHHGLMQNHGIVRWTQHRAGRQLDASAVRLDLAACVLAPLAALGWRAHAVCTQYAGAPLVAPPTWAIGVCAVLGVGALFGWAVREWRAHRRGESVDLLAVGALFGTNLLWCWLLLSIEHPALPLYAFASGHYVQYLYFVWRMEARGEAALVAVPMRWRAHVAPPVRVGWLLALVVVGAAVTLGLTFVVVALRAGAEVFGLRPASALDIPPWAAAMIGVNLSHYWLDRRIWRRPDPRAADMYSGSHRWPP